MHSFAAHSLRQSPDSTSLLSRYVFLSLGRFHCGTGRFVRAGVQHHADEIGGFLVAIPNWRRRVHVRVARWNVSIQLLARPANHYLSSQTSSIRAPLEMLLTMIVSPFTQGCQQVARRS